MAALLLLTVDFDVGVELNGEVLLQGGDDETYPEED